MAEVIKDGRTSNTMHVDPNFQGHVFAITEDEAKQAAQNGNAYNLNTGTVALTGTSDTALMYFKNDEDQDFIVTAVAVGMGTRSATVSDAAQVTIVRNPTTGTIFNATPDNVDMNSNNNFGSNKTLKSTTLAYKGTDGDTFTNGTDHALLYFTGTRLFAGLDIELPKGSGIGINMNVNTSGGANVYCAIIGYVKDSNNK